MIAIDFATALPQSNEVFAEKLETLRVDDVPTYVKKGVLRQKSIKSRTLYRLRYVGAGVEYQFLASFTARVVALESDKQGAVAVIVVKGRVGQAFVFRVPLLWLVSGKPHHARKFLSALYGTHGAVGCFVFPGRLAATIRAILSLSAEGEPMP